MAIVIDADKHILGRLSTNIAKRILNGEEVIVVNAEKAIITGDRQVIFNKYLDKYHRGKQTSGPFFPKRADLILKKTVRGNDSLHAPKRKRSIPQSKGICWNSQRTRVR